MRIVAGVVVAQSHDRGIAEQCVFQCQTHIHCRFCESAVRQLHPFDEFEVVVHQQQPCLLHRFVLQQGMHKVVDGCGRVEFFPLLNLLHLSALAQFAGRQNGDGLGRPQTLVALVGQLVDAHLAQGVEVVVAVVEHPLHQGHGTLVG